MARMCVVLARYQWRELQGNAQELCLILLLRLQSQENVLDWMRMWRWEKGVRPRAAKWQSKAVAFMWVLMPLLLVGMVPSLLHTAQSPMNAYSTLGNAQESANISRQITLYFIFVCCFVDNQWWGIIVPLGLIIQCAFDYQCHSFLSTSDTPNLLTSC